MISSSSQHTRRTTHRYIHRARRRYIRDAHAQARWRPDARMHANSTSTHTPTYFMRHRHYAACMQHTGAQSVNPAVTVHAPVRWSVSRASRRAVHPKWQAVQSAPGSKVPPSVHGLMAHPGSCRNKGPPAFPPLKEHWLQHKLMQSAVRHGHAQSEVAAIRRSSSSCG